MPYELCKLMQSTITTLQLLFIFIFFPVNLHMQVILAVFVPVEGRLCEQEVFLGICGYLLSVNNKVSK